MKILYITRKNVKECYGGAEIQILKTANALKNIFKDYIDIDFVDINNFSNIDFLKYDIVHIWDIRIFNTTLLSKIKKNKKTKYILSSIFWNFTDSIIITYTYFLINKMPLFLFNILGKVLTVFSKYLLYNIVPSYAKRKKHLFLHSDSKIFRGDIIKSMDCIIPNSDEEGKVLCKYSDINYSLQKKMFLSIPNAVDIDYLEKHKDNNFMNSIKDCVLIAGRIEPLKNQLGVLIALMEHPEIPIIIAGAEGEKSSQYNKQLRKLATKRGNVYFTGKINQEDLFSLYKHAKVHVLASFRESPGLATLEALMCGCQIVVSEEKYCPIKYYQFDKYGFICNPYDVKSIKSAILNAYNNPKNIKLSEEYIKFFSYENVANMTYNVYERVLSEKE